MKHIKGFSLLEVLLAVVVVTVAGLGAYSLFDSGVKSNNITEAENQAVQIANVYTDLASSGLTNNVVTDGIVTLLQNSGRLSSKYFSSTPVQMNNAFGEVPFFDVTPYSFGMTVRLGCLPSNSSVPQQFLSKVQDVYSCSPTEDKDDLSDCGNAVGMCSGETGGSSTTLTLYFNMNN